MITACANLGPSLQTGTYTPPDVSQTGRYSQSIDKSCHFEKMPGKAYLISPEFKKYVSVYFFYDAEKEKVYQDDESRYVPLVAQMFKVVETGVITQEDTLSRQPYLSEHRYTEGDIKGIPYTIDKAFSTKLVTEDCSIFYLNGGATVKSLLFSVVAADGSSITEDDVLVLYGSEPLERKSMDTTIEYDRFEKQLKLSTPYYNDMLIRGSVNTKNQSVSYLQLYLNLVFLDKWGFISNAVDTNGVRHEVVKISTDTDCSYSDMLGCKLTETIGVTVSEEFLNKNRDGFELKVFGTKEKIVKVSSHMVESFLSGLNKAKTQVKSGDLYGAP